MPRYIEPLEPRALLSLTVQLDYTYDTNNFFDTADKRTTMQAAANQAVSRYADHLSAIAPSGSNTWKAILDHPATGGTAEIDNLTIPADVLLVFVGGRSMSALGLGGPGGFSSTGTTTWNDMVASRGQSNVRGSDARDFGPYGGSIAFDTDPSGGWYFGLDPGGIGSHSDFYSVALHEMTHLLGFGTADSFSSRVSGSLFTGPAAVGEYDGAGMVPLSGEHAHWSSGTMDDGQETAMDPDLTTGERKTLTALDLAGMDDIGWEIPLAASLGSANSVTTAGATSTNFTITYSHYTKIDVTTLGAGDVTISGPSGFSAAATLVGSSGSGKSVTATYSLAAPGGTFDGSDSGTYTVSIAPNEVGDGVGNFAPAGPLGSFVVDIDAPPTATFTATNVTQLGGTEHTFMVTYSDVSGIDASSIDPADVSVTRASDGATLTVTSVSLNTPGNGSPRTATYTVAAPGGFWNSSDNGTYTVSLVADQLRDVNGNASDPGTLGTFDIAVQAVVFSAGSPATYTDATGDVVTVSLKGPGSGEVLFDASGNADASGLTLAGTTTASALTITSSAKGAGTALHGLTSSGPLKSIVAKNTDFSGVFDLSGTLAGITFRNATGSFALSAPGGAGTSITLAQAQDLSINSASPIKTIKAAAWLDTDSTPDTIAATSIASIAVKGAFQANVSAATLNKLTAGDVTGIEIRTTQSIGSIKTALFAESLIYAGIQPGLLVLPTSLTEFVNPLANIKSVSIKNFDKSRVAAGGLVSKSNFTFASLGSSAGAIYGVVADRINVGVANTFKGPIKVSKISEPDQGSGMLDFVFKTL